MSELVDDAIFADEFGYPIWCPCCEEFYNSMDTPCPECNWPQKRTPSPLDNRLDELDHEAEKNYARTCGQPI